MTQHETKPSKSGLYFLLSGLAAAVGFYIVLFTYNYAVPAPPANGNSAQLSMLEQCRRICLAYGLVPTGNIKQDAQAYLDVVRPKALPSETAAILADADFTPVASEEHPLLGKPAPEFALPDHSGQTVRLSELQQQGPVIVVFYYGYYCSHCVAQLFALNDDLKHFQNLGATIVAVSADPPEETAARIEEYGAFGFPVVSDHDNTIAKAFSTFIPADEESDELLLHGTFVVSESGEVLWAQTGPTPFVDNKSLLFTLEQQRTSRHDATALTSTSP